MSKNLLANEIRLNLVSLLQKSVDPSQGAGIVADIGSFLLRSGTGQAWLKTGSGNTNWTKLVQSFNWTSVKDFGAKGDDATDDTAAIQAAIAARAALGGGVVFFPPGTYRVSQITITNNAVQLLGAGASSILRWTFNAATVAGSMLTITGAANIKISMLQFSGAGLTNPAASRANHLLRIANSCSGVQVFSCLFGGMVANSGDGVHVFGAAGQLAQKWQVADCRFEGCSRYGVGVNVGSQYGWIVESYFTNNETDIGIVALSALANVGTEILGNQIVHTGAERRAIRIEGDAAAKTTSTTFADNIILGGFISMANLDIIVDSGNIQTSGAFASTDGARKAVNVTRHNMGRPFVLREAGSSLGPCMEWLTCSDCLISYPLLLTDKVGGNFVKFTDCARIPIEGVMGRATDAGSGASFGIDVQAIAIDATDMMIGPGNHFTAVAGSFAAMNRLLVNGANVTNISVVGSQGDNCDYGLQLEDAGTGSFNGQVLYSGNNFDSTIGNVNRVGGSALTVPLRIGFNAGTIGAQLFEGAGSPEGVITARAGSQYMNTSGGQAITYWYKETGTGATGWVAMGGQPIVFGAGDISTVSTALFMAPGFIAIASATETKMVATRPGTIRNLYINVPTAGVTNEVVTYTIRKNGVDTTLLASIANTATGVVSNVIAANAFTVVAGDLLSLKITKANPVATGQANVTATIELI